MAIDHLSLSTTPVHLFRGDELVSLGTGFFYIGKYNDGQVLYLVTNYHVLTGNSPLSQDPPKGNYINFCFHISRTDPSQLQWIKVPLFTVNNDPVWISSSGLPEADIALIPIPHSFAQGCEINAIDSSWSRVPMRIRPTSEAAVIGYPHGYYDKKNSLPIWKTGNIASEPYTDFDGKPLIVIDVSAFPGMSGSPVFAIANGMFENEDGNSVSPGSPRRFLGIFASMQILGEKKFLEEFNLNTRIGIHLDQSLELGHIWKAHLLEDIVENTDIDKWVKDIGSKIQG